MTERTTEPETARKMKEQITCERGIQKQISSWRK